MKIGVLGSGKVGQTLGQGFANLGHQVLLGSRTPARGKIKAWLAEAGENASAGTFKAAAAFGEVIILAVNWFGLENALKLAGPENFNDKPVIDCTNPIRFSANGPPVLALGYTDSAGETVQRRLPAARVVKAFNTIEVALMVKPDFPAGPPTTFICGNNAAAKAITRRFLKDFGWEVSDVGDITAARYLEPLAMVWILHALNTGSANHAFKLLRKLSGPYFE